MAVTSPRVTSACFTGRLIDWQMTESSSRICCKSCSFVFVGKRKREGVGVEMQMPVCEQERIVWTRKILSPSESQVVFHSVLLIRVRLRGKQTEWEKGLQQTQTRLWCRVLFSRRSSLSSNSRCEWDIASLLFIVMLPLRPYYIKGRRGGRRTSIREGWMELWRERILQASRDNGFCQLVVTQSLLPDDVLSVMCALCVLSVRVMCAYSSVYINNREESAFWVLRSAFRMHWTCNYWEISMNTCVSEFVLIYFRFEFGVFSKNAEDEEQLCSGWRKSDADSFWLSHRVHPHPLISLRHSERLPWDLCWIYAPDPLLSSEKKNEFESPTACGFFPLSKLCIQEAAKCIYMYYGEREREIWQEVSGWKTRGWMNFLFHETE